MLHLKEKLVFFLTKWVNHWRKNTDVTLTKLLDCNWCLLIVIIYLGCFHQSAHIIPVFNLILTLRRYTPKTRTDRVCRKSPQAPKRAAWGGRVGWISYLFYKHPFMNLTFDIFWVSFILLKCASSICGPSCIFLTQIVRGLVFGQSFKQLLTFYWSFWWKKKYLNWSDTLEQSYGGQDLFFFLLVQQHTMSRDRSDSFICISSNQSKGIRHLGGGGVIRVVNLYKHIILVPGDTWLIYKPSPHC